MSEENQRLVRQFVRDAITELTEAQLNVLERAARPRRRVPEARAARLAREGRPSTIRRLDREFAEARDFLRSIDDGEVDQLFRDAEMKTGVRAAVHEHSLSNSPCASFSLLAFSNAASWLSVSTRPS